MQSTKHSPFFARRQLLFGPPDCPPEKFRLSLTNLNQRPRVLNVARVFEYNTTVASCVFEVFRSHVYRCFKKREMLTINSSGKITKID